MLLSKGYSIMIDQENFSNDLKEQIANNFKKLNNVYANVPTIYQYLQQIFLTQT